MKSPEKSRIFLPDLILVHRIKGGKKGADGGIFWFGARKQHKAIVQVKGGKIGVKDMRELDAVVTQQKAAIGILLCLEEPTRPMGDWADQSAHFDVDGYGTVPRLQIVTVEAALARGPDAVETRLRHADTYKPAPRERSFDSQGKLDL